MSEDESGHMRIAILNWCDQQVGGVEVYLNNLLQELGLRGHTLRVCVDQPIAGDTEPIRTPDGTEVWTISESGPDVVLERLRAWKPDIVFRHIFDSAEFERQVFDIAPTVFFGHAYYGTCISGLKMFRLPLPRPCDRRLGPACLALYLPRRCGGLSPVTMIREYTRQSEQRELIPKYEAIVTHSEHMRVEYIRHGAHPDRVFVVPFCVAASGGSGRRRQGLGPASAGNPIRLLFLGRMDYVKGGRVLLEALPLVASALDRNVVTKYAGDGPQRLEWERGAQEMAKRDGRVKVDFVGWINRDGLDDLFAETDLLIVPSLWPEPFGQVGLEAGLRGVPSVAFEVGGIPTWLRDGVNGRLVPSGKMSASALAKTIIECTRDTKVLTQLAKGAYDVAQEFAMDAHVSALLRIFEQCRRDKDRSESRTPEGERLVTGDALS